ncbi:hypothetical protein SAMN05444358_105166 [Ruegeria halocynthiae]|uniref:Uncharacterized protein n=1 Tax=Ruegeria halocynthiae TaxID=985054 RepID=A0A1H3BFV8_9RHOB|nr:hypothetical protein [Ruegeria halocynthiae]SDX40675.1 hypothetical protein SAMN05444358_105166 [Ruegeria halocynthiae]
MIGLVDIVKERAGPEPDKGAIIDPPCEDSPITFTEEILTEQFSKAI